MARNDSFRVRWASNPAQFERPQTSLIERGWAGGANEDPPEAKWENWWHNRVDEALAELEAYGALRWFADVPYEAGALVRHGGVTWRAVVSSEGVEPGGALDVGHWMPNTQPLALEHLRGIPFPWPGEVPPPGAVAYNGAEANRADFQELWGWALANDMVVTEAEWQAGRWGLFSSGDGVSTFRFPDMRGEFVRGWDAGRGVDPGRALGSYQADAFQGHRHASAILDGAEANAAQGDGQAVTRFGLQTNQESSRNLVLTGAASYPDSSNGEPRVANETRSRSVAYNYCAFY